ncbi:MAG: MBL fold metallo-hydrolase [Candidatus Aminicenantes bacterium]|nr:MBL fold metallo-hydrolase [Candidatus Aminicenantes bacterium]
MKLKSRGNKGVGHWFLGVGFMALVLPLTVHASVLPNNVKVTILYDNYVHTQGTKADWGFACLIEGTEKTILFDTGTKPEIFWHNIQTLGVDITKADVVVISHEHGDHTGGLWTFLEKKKNVPVYVLASFSNEFEQKVMAAGSQIIRISVPQEICSGIYLTGELKGRVNEQALIFATSRGAAVLTGCAHPGIVEIVERSKAILNQDVYFVFGGFHLMEHSQTQVNRIIEGFQESGVVKCGATHCTGEQQIEWFKQAYGENYVPMGVGRVIEITK